MLASPIPSRAVALAVMLASGAEIASAQDHKLELSVSAGNAHPPFVLIGPAPMRLPNPTFESDEKQDLWLTGFDVRAYWMKQLSLLVQSSFGNNPIGHFAFVQPSFFPGRPDSDVSGTVEHRVWTLSLLQSVDLIGHGRVRPWVAGGTTFIRVVDHQELVYVPQSNPPNPSVSTTDIDRDLAAVLATVGVKIYLSRRLFISGDESFRGYLGDAPLGAFNAMWRAGIGVGF